MAEESTLLIDIRKLRIGMFIMLDLGWMKHPFPVSKFKLTSAEQISVLRSLGLQQVRYDPARSDVAPEEDGLPPVPSADVPEPVAASGAALEAVGAPGASAPLRAAPPASPAPGGEDFCERRFFEVARRYRRVVEQARSDPQQAKEQSSELVQGCVDELISNGESVIRLLGEVAGDRSTLHSVNVMVLSMLLGQVLKLSPSELAHLGLAALLHDLGKAELPERVRAFDDRLSVNEYRLYQEHVALGVGLAQRMELPPEVVQAMARHHELHDGSGYPARLQGEAIDALSRILALVNRYDNLCNPARLALALTPHEALSVIYAQMRTRFEPVTLRAFIRMMGVYPPGSVVQLVNDRYALVVSVNSARPLKPRVLIHDTRVPRHENKVTDLELHPELGIKRSLKPSQLPRAVLEYLSPRARACYYFERALSPIDLEDT